jgi:hypothetical protein
MNRFIRAYLAWAHDLRYYRSNGDAYNRMALYISFWELHNAANAIR